MNGPIGVLHEMLVKVTLIFPYYFVILDFPIILGIQFLNNGSAFVDLEKGKMKFILNNEQETFDICRCIKNSGELKSLCSRTFSESCSKVKIDERLGVEVLEEVIMNF